MSQQINLYNPIFLKKSNYFATRFMILAMGLIAISSVFFYVFASYQVNQLAKQIETTSKLYTEEQLRFATFSSDFSPEKNNQNLQNELSQLEQEAATQQDILETLKSGVIGNTDGYSEYMRAFARQVVNGLWLNGFDIEGDGAHMKLSGGVVSPVQVPAYIQRLSKEKVMKGKTFSSMQMRQPRPVGNKQSVTSYVEFSIQSDEPRGEVK